jgi:hypothetical protein
MTCPGHSPTTDAHELPVCYSVVTCSSGHTSNGFRVKTARPTEVRPADDMTGLSRQDAGMRPTAYRRNTRGLRDRQAFERIQLQAGELFAADRYQAEVAHQLGVSRQNVSRSAGPTGHRAPVRCPAERGPPGAPTRRPRAWLRHRPLDP